jgi:hypothetical protein
VISIFAGRLCDCRYPFRVKIFRQDVSVCHRKSAPPPQNEFTACTYFAFVPYFSIQSKFKPLKFRPWWCPCFEIHTQPFFFSVSQLFYLMHCWNQLVYIYTCQLRIFWLTEYLNVLIGLSVVRVIEDRTVFSGGNPAVSGHPEPQSNCTWLFVSSRIDLVDINGMSNQLLSEHQFLEIFWVWELWDQNSSTARHSRLTF